MIILGCFKVGDVHCVCQNRIDFILVLSCHRRHHGTLAPKLTEAVFTIIVNRLEGERPTGKHKDERKSLQVPHLHIFGIQHNSTCNSMEHHVTT